MALVSVIIPIFNVENYLKKCLKSIINQTLKDIEIICINDGSSDSSLNILNDFASSDERIIVLSQKNHGPAKSRNEGLKIAKGKYIFFVDSDDYIQDYTLEKLYENAKNNDSDIVMFKMSEFIREDELLQTNRFNLDEVFEDTDFNNFTFTYKDIKPYVLNNSFSACSKFYKKSFLDSYDDFTFPENLIFEDVPFHVKSLIRSSKISFVSDYLYNYRVSNSNSIMHSDKNRNDIFKICNLVENDLKNEDCFEEFEREFSELKTNQIYHYAMQAKSEDYLKTAKEEISKLDLDKLSNRLFSKANVILECEDIADFIVKKYELEISELKSANEIIIEKNKKLKQKNAKLKDKNSKLKEKNKILSDKNEEILSSRSWKITKPLRKIKKR
ncbi:MAG: glycosyltransferase [Methanobacteriaceae archaeon]|nr:glycosyltransferase [Methanobacteriaceae archaeon]